MFDGRTQITVVCKPSTQEKIFGRKIYEGNELIMIFHMEFPYLRTLPGIVRMVKSERLRWAAYVDRQRMGKTCIGETFGKTKKDMKGPRYGRSTGDRL